MKTKNGMPLGIGSPYYAATLTKFKRRFAFLSLLFCMLMLSSNVWGYSTYLTASVGETDTGKGLVYVKTSNSAPQPSAYRNSITDGGVQTNAKSTAANHYAWALPARGYVFTKWTFSGASAAYVTNNHGTADVIKTVSNGGNNPMTSTTGTATAVWNQATSFDVIYKEPEGGNYHVSYNYRTVANGQFTTTTVKESYDLTPTSGDWTPTGLNADQNGKSYAADEVTLTCSEPSFDGWYENDVKLPNGDGVGANHTYTYTIDKDATVTAKFKYGVITAPEEQTINTSSNTADVVKNILFSVEERGGDWSASDFDATISISSGNGSITVGAMTYSSGTLTVPVTYNANGFYDIGTTATLTIAPTKSSWGESASVIIKGLAEEVFDYDARVIDGETITTGLLADMLAHANTLSSKPTLQIMRNVSVSATMQVKKSMTLDLNSKVLSATTLNTLILVQGDDAVDKIELTITDNSYLKTGKLQMSNAANATIAGVKIADANKVTFSVVNLTVNNTAVYASNTSAKAYGIWVAGATGNIVMSSGAVHSQSEQNAYGIYVESGNATINGVIVEAEASAKAYAFYSAANSNITGGQLSAFTTTGDEAHALVVNAGTTTTDSVTMEAVSAQGKAYGVNVAGGVAYVNGGAMTITGSTNNIFGVNVQAGARATVQQKPVITVNGDNYVYGVQNAGTLLLLNGAVTVSATANYATAVNTVSSSAVSTTIEGGTYQASTATDHAYGLHHQYGTLSVDGGTYTATTGTNAALAVRAAKDATIANATMIAETTGSGTTARGFTAGVENINVSLTNCTIKAKSATSTADAIYSRANVTATGCTLEAKTLSEATAHGFYAENGNNVLNNTNATVESYTTGAYGINYLEGTLTVNGGTYEVTARQEGASSATNSLAYGAKIANGKIADFTNAHFIVKATHGQYSQSAFGAHTGSGTINSTGCSYEVSAYKQAYGIYAEASSNLVLNNNTIEAIAKFETTAYGIYSNGQFSINGDKVTSDTKTHTSYPLYFAASAKGDVHSGKFLAKGASTNATDIVAPINKLASPNNVRVTGGFFYDIPNLRYYVPDGYDIYGVDNGAEEYAEGYYYTVNDHLPYENVCYITEVNRGFPTLVEAFDYARDHTGTNYNIIMTQPYTLPAGNYTLPSNATLVVPDKASRTVAQGATPDRRGVDMEMISENRLLVFESGVNLDVNGKIEVSAQLFVWVTASTAYVQGPYGRIHLEEGSTVTLNSGAALYAWGYITGQGEIRVKNGAVVKEDFQIHDMKNAANVQNNFVTSANKNTYKVFPISQYYIQNIEAPTKYYYGSRLIGESGITISTYKNPTPIQNIKIIGIDDGSQEKNFFNITVDDESAWVRKSYDPTTDRVIWETNNSAELGSMLIDIPTYGEINSLDYMLPLTNNMTIHVLSGKLEITQSVKILPSAEIIIDKTATVVVNAEDAKEQPVGLYLYDQTEWSTFASGAYIKPMVYSPSWTTGQCPRTNDKSRLKDAAIYVKGKLQIDGAIYTTANGAAIYSDDVNAGTIEFNANAASASTVYETNTSGDVLTSTKMSDSYRRAVTSAKLRNGGVNGSSFTETAGIAEDGDTYAYMDLDEDGNFQWENLRTVDECVIQNKTTNTYYAKPQDYVAITSATADANHLFYSVEGEGELKRKFINMPTDAGCQWWEVTATLTDGVYYCATNGTYYHWVPDMVQVEPGVWEDQGNWEEYKVYVTFYFTDPKSEDANKKKVLEVNYGAKPDASIVSNPTKGADAAATYTFSGWKSSNTGTTYAYTAELEPVYEDMYYEPVFDTIVKKYTITFVDANNGANVYKEVAYGSNPSCDPIKDPTARYTYYFLNWTDASSNSYAIDATLPEVTGATSYTAHWAQVVNKYTITWKNGDEVLEMDTKQEYGTATAFNGSLPTKATDDNFVYAFSGWRSSLTGQTYANGSTPAVGGETTYEAQFSTTPRYKVTFANYDGTELYHEFVTQGEQHPIYKGLTPARVRDYDGYYKFTGWKNLNGTFYAKDAELPVVSVKETYTAQYDYVTELYLITLNNIDGNGASWEGKFGVGSTPFYAPDPEKPDEPAEPTKADGMEEDLLYYEYTFSGWDPELEEVSATSTKEYTAQFAKEVKKYFITFANLDGNGAKDSVEVAYGSTPACPVTPTKADACNTYAFDHWEPAIQSVTDEATYTAVFSETPDTRTFAITFDGDNDVVVVMDVECGTKPAPATPTKEDAAFYYTFTGWSDGEHVYATADLPIASAEVTYTAQYTQTLKSYTITFVNYDGTPLQSTDFAYSAMPVYTMTDPEKPVDVANRKVYTFDGWSSTNGGAKLNTLPAVNGTATYYAHYSEATFVASVKHGEDEVYKTSWSSAYTDAQANDIIKLYDDLTFTNTVNIGKSLTIDLNGYTMYRETSSNSAIYLIYMNTANVTLTIEDSNPLGGGLIHCVNTSRSSYGIYADKAATVTINGGTVKGERTNNSNNTTRIGVGVYLANGNARLNVNGGEVIGANTNGSNYAVSHSSTSNGYTTVTGGKLKASTDIFQNKNKDRIQLTGGYYSKNPGTESGNNRDITIPSGYEKRTPTEIDGYSHKVVQVYTITFNNWNGTNVETPKTWEVGSTPSCGTTPTKEPQNLYTFIGWKNTNDDFFAADATLPDVTAAETYTAQYEEVETFDIDGDAPVTEDAEVETTTIHTDGTLHVKGDAILTTTNLILEATSNASGQLIANANTNINVTGHVYFDWTMNGSMGSVRRTWYAVAVPWEVDARTGITDKATGRTLTAGVDFDLIYYNGAKRASEGNVASCWEYVQWDIQGHDRQGNSRLVDNLLHPGRLYMMYFAAEGLKTVRFEKAAGADVMYMSPVNVSEYSESTDNDGKDANWNGIANPRTYFASLSAGSATYAQVLNNGNLDDYFAGESSPVYQTINLASSSFMVGKPVFLQATGDDPVVVTKQTTAGIVNAAPRRNREESATPEGIDAVYELTIAADGKPSSDNLFVQVAEDEKADKYVISKDLSKGGVAAKRAQMWVDRYNAKLSVNTQMLVNDEATYPLVLFAPAAGDYTISNIQSTMSNEDYDLYLTLNGQAIWNLANGDYTMSLPQGNTADYGLRISARKSPTVATGIDEAVVDAKGETQKVIIEDKVYIIRGEKVYTVEGQLVK